MEMAFRRATLASIVALAMVPTYAFADGTLPPKVLYEITLDFDHDGKLGRAVMAQTPGSIYADLYIYMGAGADTLDLSRPPTILKKDLTTDPILGMDNNGKGSLIVKSGQGGSNQYETRLTIIRRRGEFWIAGYSTDWDTRNGIGSCDINFLTGKGVASRGLAKSKPIKAKFAPIKLSDWSEEKVPKACN